MNKVYLEAFMNEVVLKIEGMACGMCEAHMNDTIRKDLPEAKKVRSSFKKGETTFLYEGEFDQQKLLAAIKETGYECKEITVKPYQKKGLFAR